MKAQRECETGALISSKPSVLTNAWTGLISLSLGSVFSAVYNAWSLQTFKADPLLWHEIDDMLDPAITAISYVIPVVWRVQALLSAAGLETRAMLVRHLYGVDWLICIVAAAFVIPGVVVATSRARRNIAQQRTASSYPSSVSPADYDKAMFIFVVAAGFALYEAWLGNFAASQHSSFSNKVMWQDGDLYRLCIFLPLALLFSAIVAGVGYVKWKFRSSGDAH